MLELVKKYGLRVLELVLVTGLLYGASIYSYNLGTNSQANQLVKERADICMSINERGELMILDRKNSYKPIIILSDSATFGVSVQISTYFNPPKQTRER